MKRRNFLKTLGIGALAVPVAIEAVKGIEVPKTVVHEDEMLLESLHHNAYVEHFNECKVHIEQGFDLHTINLIAPVKPSKIGQAIYIYTDKDNAGMHNIIHIPSIYFDEEDMPQMYIVVGKNRRITELYPEMHFKYTCYPLSNNLALTKEIPVTQKLIIGASAFSPDELI